jgi:hypothetical protein
MRTVLKLRSGVICKCKANIRIRNTFLLLSDNLYLSYIPHFSVCGKKMIEDILLGIKSYPANVENRASS